MHGAPYLFKCQGKWAHTSCGQNNNNNCGVATQKRLVSDKFFFLESKNGAFAQYLRQFRSSLATVDYRRHRRRQPHLIVRTAKMEPFEVFSRVLFIGSY
jgi:hypothetical protein